MSGLLLGNAVVHSAGTLGAMEQTFPALVADWTVAKYFTHVSSGALEKLASFSKLKDGWYYGMGRAPRPQQIQAATFAASSLEWLQYEVEVFPGESGEILVSGKREKLFIEITVERDDIFTLESRVDGEEPKEENLTGLGDLLSRLWATACDISVSFTHFGGTPATPAFATSRSSLQARPLEEVFQSSIRPAQPTTAGASAPIFQNTTSRNFLPRSSYGDSTARYFQVTA